MRAALKDEDDRATSSRAWVSAPGELLHWPWTAAGKRGFYLAEDNTIRGLWDSTETYRLSTLVKHTDLEVELGELVIPRKNKQITELSLIC